MNAHAHLTNLPEELINNICLLIVQHSRYIQPRGRLFKEPVRRPPEFNSLGLTCKILHRIVTPHAWARIDMKISYTVDAKKDFRTSLTHEACTHLDFLSSLPRLAAHVHTLSLHLGPRSGAFRADPGLPRAAIERLLLALHSLRAFHINDANCLTPVAARALLSLPSLRLLDIEAFRGHNAFHDPMHDGLYFPQLEALAVSGQYPPGIFARSTSLRSILLDTRTVGPNPISNYNRTPFFLPWRTLRELGVIEGLSQKIWRLICDSFEEYVQNSVLPALRQLCLHTQMDRPFLNHLLTTFAAADLQILILIGLEVDLSCLSFIVDTFPRLRELSLLSSHSFETWPGVYLSYASSLNRAVNLQTLEWNNICNASDEPFHAVLRDCSEEAFRDKLLNLFYPIGLSILAAHSSSLTTVRHPFLSRRFCDTCVIKRDEAGRYQDCQTMTVAISSTDPRALLTPRSWDVMSTPYI